METIQEVDAAIARLSRRDPHALAIFIVSLVHDDGPIGEHVRTFVVGDDLAQTVDSLKARINDLRDQRHRYYRHRDGAQVGERWDYILDAIETLVLPVDAQQAFDTPSISALYGQAGSRRYMHRQLPFAPRSCQRYFLEQTSTTKL